MTYMQFHYVFTIPIFMILTFIVLKHKSSIPRLGWYGVGALCALALLYTTPWDNYLVYKQIWSYGQDRVMAVIGYVPIEEYFFFIIQTLMSGFLCLYIFCVKSKLITKCYKSKNKKQNMSLIFLLWLTSFMFLFFDSYLYLGLILTWSLPVILIQWFYGYEYIIQNIKIVIPLIFLPTIYLWIADWYAINQMHIWSISSSYTTGLNLFGLPIEEMLFFLMTNIMVVQGLGLLLHPECQKKFFKREF